MPFLRSAWKSGVSGSNGPTQHYYTTPDAATVVDTNGYFNALVNEVAVGDLIYSVCNNGGAIVPMLFVVRQITPTVDVTDGTAINMTNTR
jgi:hypothetical protein